MRLARRRRARHWRARPDPLLGAVPRRRRPFVLLALRLRSAIDAAIGRHRCWSPLAVGVPRVRALAARRSRTKPRTPAHPGRRPIRPSAILTITANDLGGIGAEGQIVGFVLTLLVLLALFAVARDQVAPRPRPPHGAAGAHRARARRPDARVRHPRAIFVTEGTYESRVRRGVRAVPPVGRGSRRHALPLRLVATGDRRSARPRRLARWLPQRDRSSGRSSERRSFRR